MGFGRASPRRGGRGARGAPGGLISERQLGDRSGWTGRPSAGAWPRRGRSASSRARSPWAMPRPQSGGASSHPCSPTDRHGREPPDRGGAVGTAPGLPSRVDVIAVSHHERPGTRPHRTLALVAKAGVATPEANLLVDLGSRSSSSTFAWPKLRLAVEMDSRYHDTPTARRADAARDADAEAADWRVAACATGTCGVPSWTWSDPASSGLKILVVPTKI